MGCQLETSRHCLPTAIGSALYELPKSLNESYERTLLGINEEKRANAYRIFQCLVASIRPLRVEEVADASATRTITEKGPTGWCRENAEEFVLSACSTLVTVVNVDGNKVVQFSHLSVRQYLTSHHIATSGPVSYFHILPKLAHAFLASACLSVLLQLDDKIDETKIKDFPLASYAAEHWFVHAQFEDVSSCIQYAMERLFDRDKPHFAAWVWLYNIDNPSCGPTTHPNVPNAVPLYYAALCGFRGIAERLLRTHPQDVHARGGRCGTPLHAALDKGHANVALLLLKHGADVKSRGLYHYTPLHLSAHRGFADITQLLIDCGADPNAKNVGQESPLIMASNNERLGTVRLLLKSGADANQPDNSGWTPLHVASLNGDEDIVRLLLDHGANANTENDIRDTPLHIASFQGKTTTMRLLLERGADVGARDIQGGTPLHDAARSGCSDAVQLLLHHSGDVNAQNGDDQTALHMAAYHGHAKIGNLLLTRGADVNAQDGDGWTALHLAAYRGHVEVGKFLLARGGRWYTQNNEGNTPLQVALDGDHNEMAQLLSKRCWGEKIGLGPIC